MLKVCINYKGTFFLANDLDNYKENNINKVYKLKLILKKINEVLLYGKRI